MHKLSREKLDKSGFRRVGYKAPSNIALVKYWGKKGNQLPINPSLSYTLSACHTKFEVYYKKTTSSEKSIRDFYFEGILNHKFGKKAFRLLDIFEDSYSDLKNYDLVFNSWNSFPHSSGIASSASSMCALSLCLLEILEGEINYAKASHFARLGSGSASRSVYGGVVSWGKVEGNEISSDDYSWCRNEEISANMLDVKDAIVIISDGQKKVSSTKGHQLMDHHPYKSHRIKSANSRYENLIKSMKIDDYKAWGEIIEQEALELHALMMTSEESYMLMEPHTITVINKVRDWRENTKVPLYFTLDAGPNVHLIYPSKFSKDVEDFLKSDINDFNIIYDRVGDGPKKWELE